MRCYDENLLRQFHSFHLDLTKFFVDHILIRMPQGVFVNEDWLCNCDDSDRQIDLFFVFICLIRTTKQTKRKKLGNEMRSGDSEY